MANTIIMPKLSPTMEEGQISRWLKKEGDAIEANEAIAEVDTDKATMEVTSLDAGTLLKIVVGDGANAKLGETIGIIGAKGEDFSALMKDSGAANGASSTARANLKINPTPNLPTRRKEIRPNRLPIKRQLFPLQTARRRKTSPKPKVAVTTHSVRARKKMRKTSNHGSRFEISCQIGKRSDDRFADCGANGGGK